jgi:hypothetical protein
VEATEEGINDQEPAAAWHAGEFANLDLAGTRRLCAEGLRRLPVDGAAVSVRGESTNNELLHATDPVIARLDDLQFVIGEGPCLDAYRLRAPVLEADLASAAAVSRWPVFAREAFGTGAAAVFAFPLQAGSVPFGVLELYRAVPGDFSEGEKATALLLADRGAHDVLEDFEARQLMPTASDSDAVFGRAAIAQATGMIAVQRGITVAQALIELRAAAFAANRATADVAADVLAGRMTFVVQDPPTG